MSELADTVLVTDQYMGTLIEESSLGTTGARQLRQRVSPHTADQVVTRAEAAPEPDDLAARRNRAVHGYRARTPADPEFDRLVVDAQAGDRDAIAALFVKLQPMVQRYCRARIGRSGNGSYSEADDVTQEICLGVLGALKKFPDAPSSFVPFVYGIASHKVADHYRRTTRDRSDLTANIPDGVDPTPDPEQQAMAEDERGRLLRQFRTLPRKHQDILRLRLIVGLSAQETGHHIGMTAAQVRVVQHRALNKLRTMALADEHPR